MARALRVERELNKAQFNRAARELEKDIERIVKKLNTIPKQYRSETRKKILKEAAKPLIAVAKQKAPRADGNRPRTITLKKGGQVEYYPGNLEISIGLLPFRKSPSVFVGPKFRKKRKAGDTYGTSKRKADAYYAGFIEFGTSKMQAQPFMRPAYDQTKTQVLGLITQGVERELKKWILKNRE